MQSISYYPDIQGDCDGLSFWTFKDFQPAFALTQVEIDYSKEKRFVLDCDQAVHCLCQSITTFHVIQRVLKKGRCVTWLLSSLCGNVPGFKVSELISLSELTVVG